jgi:hemerythrin
MSLIEWNARLSLGIDEIDTQHRKLIELINDLDRAMEQGKGKAVIGRTIDGLVAYTQFHFGAEEKLMTECGYPGVERHKLDHVAFVKKLIDFKYGYAKGQIGLSIAVMSFLSNWLTGHIQGTDRQYVPHMTSTSAV